jgi:hypothetical protein
MQTLFQIPPRLLLNFPKIKMEYWKPFRGLSTVLMKHAWQNIEIALLLYKKKKF